jgi:hypothetical protein
MARKLQQRKEWLAETCDRVMPTPASTHNDLIHVSNPLEAFETCMRCDPTPVTLTHQLPTRKSAKNSQKTRTDPGWEKKGRG